MDKEQMLWLQATLTVQAYIIETVLAGLIAQAPDREKALATLTEKFRTGLQFRALAPSLQSTATDPLVLQGAAIRMFDDVIARLRAGMGMASPATPAPGAH